MKGLCVPDGSRISNSRLQPKGDIAAEALKGGAGALIYVRYVPCACCDDWSGANTTGSTAHGGQNSCRDASGWLEHSV